MQKVWQWMRDRKTHTIRKWRSALLRDDVEPKKVPRHVESLSALNRPSSSHTPTPPDYEEFFDETAPQIQEALDRRESFGLRRDPKTTSQRSTRLPVCPVLPPDVEDSADGAWPPKKSPTPRRSPRQIRFKIPEVQISFEEDEPQRILFEEPHSRSHSPIPPTEIEWSPAGNSPPNSYSNPGSNFPGLSASYSGGAMESPRPAIKHHSMVSFECSDDPPSPPRRSSMTEKTRKLSLQTMQRRQSQVQVDNLVASMSGRRASTTLIPLTCAQIHLIRSLWRQIYTSKGPTVIGTSIFHRLCFKSPQVKEQVRRVPLPPQFNNHDGFIKAHCKAMAELVDQIVENLDNLDSMTEELVRIGRVHARILKGELTGKLWNTVAETFIDCTLEWGDKRCRSETVRKAWALIIAFMTEKIKLGHHEQRKLMLTTRQSMPQIPSIQLDALRISH